MCALVLGGAAGVAVLRVAAFNCLLTLLLLLVLLVLSGAVAELL